MTASRFGTIALLSIGLAACGGGGGGSSVSVPPTPPVTAPPPPATAMAFSNQTATRGLAHESGFSVAFDKMPGLFAGGAAVGDIDGDGDLDLFITRGDVRPNLLMINSGGSFTRSTANPALDNINGATNAKLSGPVFADMDGDGALDLFIGGIDGDGSRVFKGDGQGGFTDVTAGSGIDMMTSVNTISASLGDYDGDGDLDLAMAHWGTPRSAAAPGETETLWRNDSTATQIIFTPVSEASGIAGAIALDLQEGVLGINHDYTFAPNFIDINEDGHLDLLMVSDFRGSKVLVNNGDGTFRDETDTTQITDTNGMGTDVGDFNNDGRPDWFVSSISGNRMYKNMSGSMIDLGFESGLTLGSWGWGSCFADFDRDGDLDVYQTNGWINDSGSAETEPYSADKTRMWQNEGSDTFTNQAANAGVDDDKQGRAVVCADFDDDLDVDILLLINNSSEGAIYYENETVASRAVSVRLNGRPGNKAGIGAKLTFETASLTQTHWVRVGNTFTAQTPTTHVFGMGPDPLVTRLVVDWADGNQTITAVGASANARIVVDHPDLP